MNSITMKLLFFKKAMSAKLCKGFGLAVEGSLLTHGGGIDFKSPVTHPPYLPVESRALVLPMGQSESGP